MTMEIPLTRRDLLTFARRNRPQEGQPPKKGTAASTGAPTPPDGSGWLGTMLTRRKVVVGGATLVTGGLGLYVADRLGMLPHFSEAPLPESLGGLVQEANKMEAEFSDNDLSSKRVRERHAKIMAGIFEKDAPMEGWTKERIFESIVWTNNLDDFIKIAKRYHSNPPADKDYYTTIVAVAIAQEKVVINLGNPALNTAVLRKNGFPGDWNALKSLRVLLLHEFDHLTTVIRSDPEFLNLTDIPKDAQNPRLEGFMIHYGQQGKPAEIFHEYNETAVEVVNEERNVRLFGFYPPARYEIGQVDITSARRRLRSVVDSARIPIRELERLNRASEFDEFLLEVASRSGMHSDVSVIDRINYGVDVLNAAVYNDQPVLEDYINRARINSR